jgi:DNA-binding SARP family transcriptional activator
MLCYQQALKLYKGEYLSENLYNEWIIPVRNRYHRLYSQALLQQLELLKNESNYQSIVETCEEAFQIDPYEESVHIFYLDALIKLAQIKQATSHYHYITTKLFQELGVKPSPFLREIYREIKHKTMQKKDMNFWDILGDLKEGREQ